MLVMNKEHESIYVLQKGEERVQLADNASLITLANALFVMDCAEYISKKKITGNKQNLEVFEIAFCDNRIRVIGMADVEKIVHWMLSYGCYQMCVEKVEENNEQVEGDIMRQDHGRSDIGDV